MAAEPILLASKSPRRAALLEAAGIPFEVVDLPPVDETPPRGSEARAPGAVVERLALRKLAAAEAHAVSRRVLTADTLVFLDGAILGKPGDEGEAVRMLRRLSGSTHEVATGVAVAGPDGSGGITRRSGHRVARVTFRALSEAAIEDYVASGEPLDKAGAYALQGGAADFVRHLEGDADTVIGLPIVLVRQLLAL